MKRKRSQNPEYYEKHKELTAEIVHGIHAELTSDEFVQKARQAVQYESQGDDDFFLDEIDEISVTFITRRSIYTGQTNYRIQVEAGYEGFPAALVPLFQEVCAKHHAVGTLVITDNDSYRSRGIVYRFEPNHGYIAKQLADIPRWITTDTAAAKTKAS